jgi:hypothetical protein
MILSSGAEAPRLTRKRNCSGRYLRARFEGGRDLTGQFSPGKEDGILSADLWGDGSLDAGQLRAFSSRRKGEIRPISGVEGPSELACCGGCLLSNDGLSLGGGRVISAEPFPKELFLEELPWGAGALSPASLFEDLLEMKSRGEM